MLAERLGETLKSSAENQFKFNGLPLYCFMSHLAVPLDLL